MRVGARTGTKASRILAFASSTRPRNGTWMIKPSCTLTSPQPSHRPEAPQHRQGWVGRAVQRHRAGSGPLPRQSVLPGPPPPHLLRGGLWVGSPCPFHAMKWALATGWHCCHLSVPWQLLGDPSKRVPGPFRNSGSCWAGIPREAVRCPPGRELRRAAPGSQAHSKHFLDTRR